MNIGDAIKHIRLKRGMTISDLATAIGVSLPFLYHIEAGNRNPSQPNLERLAIVLKVPEAVFTILCMDDQGDENYLKLKRSLQNKCNKYLDNN